jgi:hypothetical protein
MGTSGVAFHLDPQLLAEILASIDLGEPSPWAVLLCKFADDSTDVAPREHYERLFTGAGRGSDNMVDFFRDVSHNHLNLGDSEVFGWFTLPINKADYAGNVAEAPPGQVNRGGLFGLCQQKATEEGVDFSLFKGTVVSMAGEVDLFGYLGGMGAMCDSLSLKPSLLGQEMGHGYGLDHARRDGSAEEYADPWDVMSTANAFMSPHSEYEEIGPALNAAAMRSRGWLREDRVWKAGSALFDATIELRPLQRLDLAGSLAAELGPYLVEFRIKEGWDAAIPRSCVLVHRFEENHSYVMQGHNGSYDLVEGDSFEASVVAAPERTAVEVIEIDEKRRVARVRLVHRPAASREGIWGQLVGGVAVDGGGGVIVGGHFHPVPPKGPLVAILEMVASHAASEEIDDVAARGLSQRAALGKIAQHALVEMSRNEAGLPSREERPDGKLLEKK